MTEAAVASLQLPWCVFKAKVPLLCMHAPGKCKIKALHLQLGVLALPSAKGGWVTDIHTEPACEEVSISNYYFLSSLEEGSCVSQASLELKGNLLPPSGGSCI